MDTTELIKLVQKYPELYDDRNPKHRDNYHISKIWEGIAAALNGNSVDVKKKWQNLRSNYAREKRKSAALAGPDRISSWGYFEKLSFLETSIRPRKHYPSASRVSTDDEDSQNMEYDLFEEECEQKVSPMYWTERLEQRIGGGGCVIKMEPVDVLSAECDSGDPLAPKRRKKDDTEEDKEEYARRFEPPQQSDQPRSQPGSSTTTGWGLDETNDPDLMFLRSLLPSIRQLGPIQNLEFKSEIIELLKRKLLKNAKQA